MFKYFEVNNDQLEINKQDFERTDKFLKLSSVLYLSWLVVDWFVIDRSWMLYCLITRLMPLVLYTLISTRPKEFQVKYLHFLAGGIYILAFITLFPLYFQTKHFFFYFTCSFIVPIFSPTSLVLRPSLQLLYPIIFYFNTLFFYKKVILLTSDLLIFSSAYSITIFVLAQIISYTEFNNRVEKLKLNKKLSKAVEDRSSLIRILIHDISNPLMVIKHRVKQLRKITGDNDEALKQLESLDKAGESLSLIAKKVREIEQASNFEVKLDFNKVKVLAVIKDIFNSFEFRFINKGVKLDLDVDISERDLIYVDEVILRENILSNLVSNALKFSDKGQTVTLGASVLEEKIIIKVKEQGTGIDQSIRDNLFDSSIKTSKQGTSGEKGTGFGLTIAKIYTNKMNGELTFNTSTKNESSESGTEFILKFLKSN